VIHAKTTHQSFTLSAADVHAAVVLWLEGQGHVLVGEPCIVAEVEEYSARFHDNSLPLCPTGVVPRPRPTSLIRSPIAALHVTAEAPA
jgi:hypothetical protein